MVIDWNLLNEFHEKVKTSERSRESLDICNNPEEASQRMINVMESGTEIPVH